MLDWRTEGEFLLAWLSRVTGRLAAGEGNGGSTGRIVVLAYHRILPADRMPRFAYLEDLVTTAEAFAAQMAVVARRFRVMPLPELVRGLAEGRTLPPHSVAISFDDGYADNLEYALPVLRRHHLPATIFLATGHVGGAEGLYWWDEISRWRRAGAREVEFEPLGRRPIRTLAQRDRLLAEVKRLPIDAIRSGVESARRRWGGDPDPAAAADFLTWDQVRALQKDRISFGSHTVNHCRLPVESPERRAREVGESRAAIERETGRPCDLFCYPDGAATGPIAREVEAAGYRGAFATRARDLVQEPELDRFQLPRKCVNYRADSTVFRFRLSPIPERIKRWREPRPRSSA